MVVEEQNDVEHVSGGGALLSEPACLALFVR